jgi:transcriptional regulator with XRE-family HTH domain
MPTSTRKNRRLRLQIAARIQERRLAAGLTVTELASRVGISQPSMHYIDTGARGAKLSTLAAIAAALKVPLKDLLPDA